MIDKHLMKLRARADITAAEEQTIRDAVGEVKTFPAGATAIAYGKPLDESTLLLDGMMCRYKDLKSGVRQITEVHVAGDFADLHSFTLKRLDHNVSALTACRVAMVPHARIREISEKHPHLARVYWFSTNLDAAIHREWALSLGRRSALARMAHLFCELHVRLGIVGLTDGLSYDLPLTQAQLGECLGLTPVHVNRMLQELRALGPVEFRRSRVTINDWAALTALAEFDPSYLYLDRRQD